MDEKILSFSELCCRAACCGALRSLTFHSPKTNGERKKIRGSLKKLSGGSAVQLESFLSEGRVTHENVHVDRIDFIAEKLIEREFSKADLIFDGGSAALMTSKGGKVTLIIHGKINDKVNDTAYTGNDRKKRRILTGTEKFLFALGISDKNGRVHDRMQAKFRQINRFCEYIAEAKSHLRPNGILRVADLCCGKSYLSFAAYYTLTEILGRDTVMYCVDLKESVIEYCASVANSLGFSGMNFEVGNVTRFTLDCPVDMVISLHACDTATDAVLDTAIELGADVILSTPCCHRELSENIDCPPLHFVSSRPLLRQKLCTAATDALRLMRLEAAGYETDCTELIDPENTPKNIMLRAYKKKKRIDILSAKLAEYKKAYMFMYGKLPSELPVQCNHTAQTTEVNFKPKGIDKMEVSKLIKQIGRTDIPSSERLDALRALMPYVKSGEIEREGDGTWVNNHIHTCYSFSPYTPTSAVFNAWRAGLGTAGIMDHDSVGGMREFIEAGRIMDMPVTCGFECRVSVKGTDLDGRRVNNPDQKSCAYLAMHGIPHQSIDEAEKVLSVVRNRRNDRNRKMCEAIATLVNPYGIELDFDRDVYPISMAREGGSITERHILFALAKKIISAYPDRDDACSFIEKMTSPLGKTREKLLSAPEEFYEYDILGVLKGHMVEKFYIPADAELMHISEFTALAKKLGAISAYAYLGDVGESPTGDKKAQKFEDEYLPVLFETLKKMNFSAVTYMPSRNTSEQLDEIMRRCDEGGFFQISGEDINSPRQSFICPALGDPRYSHLRRATYALIGHENEGTKDISRSMFSDSTIKKFPSLSERVAYFAALGGEKNDISKIHNI